MATGDPDFIPNASQPLYVPIPFASTYPRGTGTSGGGTGSSGSGGSGSGGVVYASALFINATCQPGDVVGAWVRATATANDVTTTTSQLSYPSIGIIISKSAATNCVVQTYGLCQGVYSGLTPNLRLFVGASGQASTGPQLASSTAYVQAVGFSVRADTIFVQPSGTLFRRDAAADSSDPAPPPSGGGTASYQPILHGDGAPDASLGEPGDAYVDTQALVIYLKDGSGWDVGRALQTTTAGAPGKDGATIINGTGAPQAGVGSVNDLYLQLDGTILWGPKTSDGWGNSGVSLVGAPGVDGSRIYRVATLPSDGSGYADGDLLIDDEGNMAQVENS